MSGIFEVLTAGEATEATFGAVGAATSGEATSGLRRGSRPRIWTLHAEVR
jgi:hypothetical protein